MKPSELRTLWNAQSAKYRARESVLTEVPLPPDFLPHAGETILDAGCGSGHYMGMYRRITPAVFGVDLSDAMVAAALRHGPTVQGDIQRLPLKTNSVDYVFSHVVIGHVPNSSLALAECARVTRPGGRLVVVVPNRLSFLAPARFVLIGLGKYSLGFTRHFTVSMLRDEGRRHGLSTQQVHVIPKTPTAPTAGRRFITWLAYCLDQGVHRLYPLWGGDLAILFEKTGEPDRGRSGAEPH